MKRALPLLAVAALWSSGATVARAQAPLEARGEFDFGYRQGEFDWNIAGTPQGTDPNVLSELEWRDIGVAQIRLGGEIVAWRHLWIGGSFTRGSIHAGENRDSDYLGDDRTLEFSRSDNGGDDGSLSEGDFGVGYMFRFPRAGGGFDLLLAAGYGIARQDLRITDGFQTIADEDILGEPLPPTGPFSGLDSSYDAEWDGTWFGIEGRLRVGPRAMLSARARLHQADFEAEANWNLREDFAHPLSFRHTAEGDGLVFRAAYDRQTKGRWGWRVILDVQRWETGAGVDEVFFDDGTSLTTRLNEANWSSVALSLGIAIGRREPRAVVDDREPARRADASPGSD